MSSRKLDEWWKQYWTANLELVMTVSVDSSLALEQMPGMKNQTEESRGPARTQLLLFKRKAGL